jgi:hypothetical protein
MHWLPKGNGKKIKSFEVERNGDCGDANCDGRQPNLILCWENDCRYVMGHGSLTGGGTQSGGRDGLVANCAKDGHRRNVCWHGAGWLG